MVIRSQKTIRIFYLSVNFACLCVKSSKQWKICQRILDQVPIRFLWCLEIAYSVHFAHIMRTGQTEYVIYKLVMFKKSSRINFTSIILAIWINVKWITCHILGNRHCQCFRSPAIGFGGLDISVLRGFFQNNSCQKRMD